MFVFRQPQLLDRSKAISRHKSPLTIKHSPKNSLFQLESKALMVHSITLPKEAISIRLKIAPYKSHTVSMLPSLPSSRSPLVMVLMP